MLSQRRFITKVGYIFNASPDLQIFSPIRDLFSGTHIVFHHLYLFQQRFSYLDGLNEDRKGVPLTISGKQVMADSAEGEMFVVKAFEMGLAGDGALSW